VFFDYRLANGMTVVNTQPVAISIVE